MSEKQDTQVQTAIRFPESLLGRVDKIVARMSKPGLTVTRTDAVRLAVFEWADRMEAEAKAKRASR